MVIHFEGSNAPSLGVEVEVQIIDPKTRKLAPQSRHLLERCRQRQVKHVKAEIHQSMLEMDTEVSRSVTECGNYIKGRLEQLSAVAQELGLELAMAGTHPFEHWSQSQVFPDPRYKMVTEKFRWLAKRVTVYGMHVHVGVPDGNAAISVMNGVVPFLPYLLALSANSPFWQGVDTGLQGCRIGVMDSFPYSGIQKQFSDWDAYQQYCQVLLDSNVISCLKDIYWHVRPNAEFGTIEFRVCDTMATFDETLAVVAFIQSLVVWLLEKGYENSHNNFLPKELYWVAPENQWIAVRDGVEGLIVPHAGGKRVKIADEIANAVDWLAPTAEALGCKEQLLFIKTMLARGNGACRQRAVFEKTGCMEAVVDALIHEFHTGRPLQLDGKGQLVVQKDYVFVSSR